MRINYIVIFLLLIALITSAVEIVVDVGAGVKPISPWIYGKNNSLSDKTSSPVQESQWQLYREAGLRMFRENGGNNCTKYNWRKTLSSHPDWYNNVYPHSWDFLAQSLVDNTTGTQGVLSFQLLGKVAFYRGANFNDYAFNQSQWWDGIRQNLAGGGEVDSNGGPDALKDGDPSLYLTDWPAESTTAILDHWFGAGGLGLDPERFIYWNMDNEPEIWHSTHDDAQPEELPAEEYMKKYFAVAKLARQKYPDIKLMGPVFTNEWQWYAWGKDNHITVNEGGVQKKYTWVEYFIKRIGEEQKASGVRLLDVFDFHFYPNTEDDPDLTMQLHRIWFDTTWNYPKANGCKLIGGGWDESITKEYIWERCRRWLEQFIGPDHGITFGMTECGAIHSDDPNVVAVWHASHLGTFADEGIEVFTPWEWNVGQWEVLHLFSRYCGDLRVESTSDLDSLVSAYSSVSRKGDTLTIILVNRDRSSSQNVAVTVNNFKLSETTFATLQLNDLPATETFQSHTSNALQKGSVTVNNNSFSLDLPTISVTAVILTGESLPIINNTLQPSSGKLNAFARNGILYLQSNSVIADADISLYDYRGRVIHHWIYKNLSAARFSLEGLTAGRYVIQVKSDSFKDKILTKPVLVAK